MEIASIVVGDERINFPTRGSIRIQNIRRIGTFMGVFIEMKIKTLTKDDKKHVSEAAALLAEAFPQAYENCALAEMGNCLENDRVALMAEKDGRLIGFAGAIPQYGKTGWELHPIVVDPFFRRTGVGRALLTALETEVAARGGIVIYLGSDDEFGKTSLADTDLYVDIFRKIAEIKNLGGHPYEFYQKNGYAIVGVVPDANGFGKPDILMAKRIRHPQ
jgi:aminoglycoside 6'-N-acetyltransferase I